MKKFTLFASFFIFALSTFIFGARQASASTVVTSVTLNSTALPASPSISVLPGTVMSAQVSATTTGHTTWDSTGWQIATSLGSTYNCFVNPAPLGGTAGPYSVSFSATAPTVAGAYNVYVKAFADSACASPIGGGTFSDPTGDLVVTPGPAATVAISAVPSSTVQANVSGASVTLSLTVQDSDGNLVADGTPVAVDADSGTVSGCGTTASGVATCTLTLDGLGTANLSVPGLSATGDTTINFVDTTAPSIASIASNAAAAGVLKIGDSITFTLTPSVAEPSASVSGSYNGQPLTWSTADGGATYTATYTVAPGDPDQATPLQISGVTLTDQASVASPPAAGNDVAETIDATTPTLTSVSIASSNSNSAIAQPGDTVTLSFTGSEALQTPTVTVDGNAATVSGGPLSWAAAYTITGSEPLGLATFSVNFSDTAGNPGALVTATSDESSVTVQPASGNAGSGGGGGGGGFSAGGLLSGSAASGSISGIVFNDQNANGVQDLGEEALSGWTVYLDAGNTGTLASTDTSAVTNSSGQYSFSDLPFGTYTVREVPQAGWGQTLPAAAPNNHAYVATLTSTSSVAANENFGNNAQGQVLGAVTSGSHPDGTLILEGQTIYLIANGEREGFRDPAEYESYGYNFSQAVTATTADDDLPVSSQVLKAMSGTLVLDSSDNRTVYMVGENGTKSGFASSAVFEGLGYSFANLAHIDLSDYTPGAVINSDVAAHPDGSLVLSNGTIWWILNGQRQGFESMTVFNTYGFSASRVVPANSGDMALPVGPLVELRDGTLVSQGGVYYIITDGQKLPFASASDLVNHGYSMSNVVPADVSSYVSSTLTI